MTELNTFVAFFDLMGYKVDIIRMNNKVYIRADDSQKRSITETVGYEDIVFLGIFNELTGQAFKLYNVSHVTSWPKDAAKLEQWFYDTIKGVEDETE